MPIPPDRERQARNLDSHGPVMRSQLGNNPLADQALIVIDGATLGPTFSGKAERIGPGPAQKFQPGKCPQNREDPGAKTHLAEVAGLRIAAGDQWRGHVEDQRSATMTFRDPIEKAAHDMKPRDLVLVLVGKQLEERPRDRVSEFRRSLSDLPFRLGGLRYKAAIARS